MLNEYTDFQLAIQKTSVNDLDLSVELSQQLKYRLTINSSIARHLVQTSQLKGFTGSLLPGECVGRSVDVVSGVLLPEWATNIVGMQIEGQVVEQTTAESEYDDRKHSG
uniref:Uncharacterized protein n=1 Tax=Moniliophthora roreri TaxID=221103 RepID=A0A0W0GES1_MONRR